jgi:hypothetical protein
MKIAICLSLAMAFAAAHGANIGASWPDRRPIGRLILADEAHINASNLNGWINGGPSIGTQAFQASILVMVQNTITNTLAMHGQGIIIWDITGAGKTSLSLPDCMYLGDPRFLNPRAAGLTIANSYSPYVPPSSRLARRGIEPALDAIADQIFSMIRDAGLVPGVALRAEKVAMSGDNVDGGPWVNGDNEQIYDTFIDQLSDLDAKLSYAYNRWGCRIFYVDSNAYSGDILSEQQNQLNPTTAAAYVYTQLFALHPDCLICPEETYNGAFSFPPIINDAPYQYDAVTARYTELRFGGMNWPFVGENETAIVPDAFTLICASDVGASDPDDTLDVIAALQANQCILMANAWYDDPGITLINNWQAQSGVNGF